MYNSSLIAFLREDTFTRKVYCLPLNPSNFFCSNTEHLLYNFDYSKGDSLNACDLKKNGYINNQDRRGRIIDSTSMLTLFGKSRKVWHSMGTYLGGGMPFLYPIKIVEGVGFDNNNGFGFDDKSQFKDFCEGTLNECDILSANEPIPISEIKISPNPVINFLDLNTFDSGTYRISNVMGEIILQGKLTKNQIDVTTIPCGLYFISIQSDKEYIGKFIK